MSKQVKPLVTIRPQVHTGKKPTQVNPLVTIEPQVHTGKQYRQHAAHPNNPKSKKYLAAVRHDDEMKNLDPTHLAFNSESEKQRRAALRQREAEKEQRELKKLVENEAQVAAYLEELQETYGRLETTTETVVLPMEHRPREQSFLGPCKNMTTTATPVIIPLDAKIIELINTRRTQEREEELLAKEKILAEKKARTEQQKRAHIERREKQTLQRAEKAFASQQTDKTPGKKVNGGMTYNAFAGFSVENHDE